MKDKNIVNILMVFAGISGLKLGETRSMVARICDSEVDEYDFEKINEKLDDLFKYFSSGTITAGELKEEIRDIAYKHYDTSDFLL